MPPITSNVTAMMASRSSAAVGIGSTPQVNGPVGPTTGHAAAAAPPAVTHPPERAQRVNFFLVYMYVCVCDMVT